MAEVYHKYVRAGEKVPPPSKEQKGREESNARFAAARARKEEALATLREAEAKKRDGELIERAEALKQATFLFVTCRQRLLALASSLPRKLVGKAPHEMKMIIDGQVRECLTELSALPDRVTREEYEAFESENGEKRTKARARLRHKLGGASRE
jgi:hypothetical protein